MSEQEPGVTAATGKPDETATPSTVQTDEAGSGDAEFEEETVVVIDDLEGSFADAIDATIIEFDDGSLVAGTVVKIDSDEVLLDIGYKSEGVIPTKELSIRNDVDPHEVVSIGEHVEALVLTKEDKDGRLILSKKRAAIPARVGHDRSQEGSRRSRFRTGHRGRKRRPDHRYRPAAASCRHRWSTCAGCAICTRSWARCSSARSSTRQEPQQRRVEPAAFIEETQREQRDEFLTNLKPGEVRKGTVSSVVNFGAFVDLGGMDGLVHVSELSWKHVDHPSSVVQVGDEVTVQVLDVDLSRERISLSLKATQQDPWQEFAGGHQVGELVYGRVTKLVPFGAFVQVGEGIEGLVHISEMAEQHVEAPEQVVTPGEELWVKIIDIDLERRRISLSIKQAAEGGEVAAEYREFYGEHAYDEHGNYIGPEFEAPAEGARLRPGRPGRRNAGRFGDDAGSRPGRLAARGTPSFGLRLRRPTRSTTRDRPAIETGGSGAPGIPDCLAGFLSEGRCVADVIGAAR